MAAPLPPAVPSSCDVMMNVIVVVVGVVVVLGKYAKCGVSQVSQMDPLCSLHGFASTVYHMAPQQ